MNKSLLSLLLIIAYLGLATFVSLNFVDVLKFLVLKLSLGWVIGTIAVRLIVMVLFVLAVHRILSLFPKEKRLKDYWAILIGIGPGFLLSFALFPIYNADYGMLSDNLKIEHFEELSADSYNSYEHLSEKKVIAFIDIGCGHCREACHKFSLIKQQNEELPFYLFFYNDTIYVEDFIETYANNEFKAYYLKSNEAFVKYAGYEFPSIFYVDENSESVYHWVGDKMNYTAMDYLIGLEQ